MEKKISIIIPTFNEEDTIAALLDAVKEKGNFYHICEVIIIDGGSTDKTLDIVSGYDFRLIESPAKGRSQQMNYASKQAKGDILYFIHADSIPPRKFTERIVHVIKPKQRAGCFMSRFDLNHWFLRAGNFFSFLPFWFCRGGGQTLYITKDLFFELGGYDESMILMEEYDLISRIQKKTRFRVIRRVVITSARDYVKHGPLRLQFAYIKVFNMYSKGATQQEMLGYLKSKGLK